MKYNEHFGCKSKRWSNGDVTVNGGFVAEDEHLPAADTAHHRGLQVSGQVERAASALGSAVGAVT